MKSHFANSTDITLERSREEIRELLEFYGAKAYVYESGPDGSTIAFTFHHRKIRLTVPLPPLNHRYFWRTPGGTQRTREEAIAEHDQFMRLQWRTLALLLKAKFAAIAAGISTMEAEFTFHTTEKDNPTICEQMHPRIAILREAYDNADHSRAA
jgi:hypothetical protein